MVAIHEVHAAILFRDRMPVILELATYELWLDPGFRDLNAVSEMLKPFNSKLMKHHPVTRGSILRLTACRGVFDQRVTGPSNCCWGAHF